MTLLCPLENRIAPQVVQCARLLTSLVNLGGRPGNIFPASPATINVIRSEISLRKRDNNRRLFDGTTVKRTGFLVYLG